MKELQGQARAELDVAPGDCFALLAAVERYPDWFEVVSRVGGNGSTQLEFEFDAAASFVPGFIPVGGAGEAIARGAVEAARAALGR